jgi:hypothetical protein
MGVCIQLLGISSLSEQLEPRQSHCFGGRLVDFTHTSKLKEDPLKLFISPDLTDTNSSRLISPTRRVWRVDDEVDTPGRPAVRALHRSSSNRR